jgi:hypothetical protein
MSKPTGHATSVGYDLPPIGTAEIIARDDDSTEFGLPEGYVDPNEYRGKTPQCDRIIGVSRF